MTSFSLSLCLITGAKGAVGGKAGKKAAAGAAAAGAAGAAGGKKGNHLCVSHQTTESHVIFSDHQVPSQRVQEQSEHSARSSVKREDS